MTLGFDETGWHLPRCDARLTRRQWATVSGRCRDLVPCHWSYGDNIARWDGGYQMTGAVMRRHHEDVIWSM
jgi:hypothetical protein